MLDIQLLIFKTVVEKGSFSQAARQLYMTQSSVSQQIQNLEGYYGVKLFDRLHRKISLTEAGTALYPFAVEIDRLYQEAREAMQGLMAEISGRLHIGASLTIGEYLMPEVLVSFSRQYPLVDIAMEVQNTEQITALVLEGKISLGFVEGPYEAPDVLTETPSGGDQLVIVAPAGHPLAKSVNIPLGHLLNERWVMREATSGTRRVFEQFISCKGFEAAAINVVMELGSTKAVKQAVKAGLGIAAISCLAVKKELANGELCIINTAGESIARTFTMLRHREKFRTRAVEKFSEFFYNEAEYEKRIPCPVPGIEVGTLSSP